MATDITIKRYNGSSWEELAPKTTVEQVDGLQTALNGKQDTSNLVTSVSSSSLDTQYPSAKLFYDTTTGIMEVAEGKTKSYVTGVYQDANDRYYLAAGAVGSSPLPSGTPVLPSQLSMIEITGSTSSVDISQYQYLYILDSDGTQILKSIDILDFNTGDVLLLIPTNLPDFWFNETDVDTVLYKLETTKVDLSNCVTTNTTQTGLTGDKTTNGTFTFDDPNNNGTRNIIKFDSLFINNRSALEGTNLVYDGLEFIDSSSSSVVTKYKSDSIVKGSAILTLPSASGTLLVDADLNAYAPKASPTFTGTVELPTTTKITGITSTGLVKYTNGVLSVDTTSYVPTTRTVNGKALSSDITLSASDVSALPSNTAYLASAGLSSDTRTLTITPSSGSAISFDSGNVTTLNTTAPTSSKTGDIWFQTSA